jgi:transcriptional regulator with XRE-family HTH domain
MDKPTVAEFLTALIKSSDLLQKDVAKRAGFDAPNVITMIKKGDTKLPLDKVGPMAEALGTDPVALLKMCLEEYQPATWRVIAPYMAMTLNDEEMQMVQAHRASAAPRQSA